MQTLNNTEQEIKWGFIGCGEVTEKKSGPAFAMIPGSSIRAVMSRSKEKARSYAQRHNVERWYTDAQQLLSGQHQRNALREQADGGGQPGVAEPSAGERGEISGSRTEVQTKT